MNTTSEVSTRSLWSFASVHRRVWPHIASAFPVVVLVTALPVFLFRLTGVMDDSVFWVVAKSLNAGKVLYSDAYFTQPPLFIWIPQLVWAATDHLLLHRVFLVGIWLLNGWLFYCIVSPPEKATRLILTGLFLSAAFTLQSYSLHTEIFVLLCFLATVLTIVRKSRWAFFLGGLFASSTFFIKPLGPFLFPPLLVYLLLERYEGRSSQLLKYVGEVTIGAAIPVAVVGLHLLTQGTLRDFWDQVIVNNANNLPFGFNNDPRLFAGIIFGSLLLPLFAWLVWLGRRDASPDLLLAVVIFFLFFGILIQRPFPHYGLFNLCLLVWMLARLSPHIDIYKTSQQVILGSFMALVLVYQLAFVAINMRRGNIVQELSAYRPLRQLSPASVHVFSGSPPRLYMLASQLIPASPYIFVYDTNRDLVIWDDYIGMVENNPPKYVLVEDSFRAEEWGTRKSQRLVDAAAVRKWMNSRAEYRQLESPGIPDDLTVYYLHP